MEPWLITAEDVGCEVARAGTVEVIAIRDEVAVAKVRETLIADVEVNAAGNETAVFLRQIESSPHVSPMLQHT